MVDVGELSLNSCVSNVVLIGVDYHPTSLFTLDKCVMTKTTSIHYKTSTQFC